MRKFSLLATWLSCIFLCLLGIGCFMISGHRVIGLVCFCIVAVILCYRFLTRLHNRKPKLARCLRITLTVCLCLFLLIFAITEFVIIRATVDDAGEDCDYLIVLGAGVNGTRPSLSLRDRIDGAYDYLQQHPNTVAILSGGKGDGENITEAECMFRCLTEAGIPEERLIKEERATSTEENLAYSLALMERTEDTRIGILSSEYHLYRAGLMAQDQGFDPIVVPAETSWLTLRVNYYIREVFAVWYYMILGGQHHDFSFLCRCILGAGCQAAFH